MNTGIHPRPPSILKAMVSTLRTRTGRETQLVILGQTLAAALGFGINVVLLRVLNLEDYGQFSLFSSALMLLAGFMHFGWIETFVRFGAKHADTPLYGRIRGLLLGRTLLSSAIVAGAVILGATAISERAYHRADFAPYLRAAALGALLTCALSFFQNDFRARRAYDRFFVVNVGTNTARFGLAAVMAGLGLLGLSQAVGIYLLVPLLFSVFCLVALRAEEGSARRGEAQPLNSALLLEMRGYNAWLLVSLFATNLIGNIDAHILAYFHPNRVLSHFGAAGKLTLPIHLVVLAITTTMLPRLSAAKDDREIRFYLSRLKLFLVPLAFLILLACWLAPPVLIWVAGPSYAGIEDLLRLQLLSTLVMVLTNPVSLVLYAWGSAKGFAYLNFAQLVVDLALDLLWIPNWGAEGAVAATLAVNTMGLVYAYSAVGVGLRARHGRKVE